MLFKHLYITCVVLPSLSIFFSLLHRRNSLPPFVFSNPVSSQYSLQVMTECSFRYAVSSAKRSSSEYRVEEVIKPYSARSSSFLLCISFAEPTGGLELHAVKVYRFSTNFFLVRYFAPGQGGGEGAWFSQLCIVTVRQRVGYEF